MSPQRGSDVSLLRPWRPGWKRFTPAVMQDLQQMRLIMFLENLALKTKAHCGAAVRRVGNVAISWLNRNAGCYRTANNGLLCGLSVQLNMLVKLTNGISGCCSRVEQTANVSAKRSYSSAVFVRRKYRVWKEVSSSGIPAFFLSRNVHQLLTLLQHNICCAQ